MILTEKKLISIFDRLICLLFGMILGVIIMGFLYDYYDETFTPEASCEFDFKSYYPDIYIGQLANGKYAALYKLTDNFVESTKGDLLIYDNPCLVKGHLKIFHDNELSQRVEIIVE